MIFHFSNADNDQGEQAARFELIPLGQGLSALWQGVHARAFGAAAPDSVNGARSLALDDSLTQVRSESSSIFMRRTCDMPTTGVSERRHGAGRSGHDRRRSWAMRRKEEGRPSAALRPCFALLRSRAARGGGLKAFGLGEGRFSGKESGCKLQGLMPRFAGGSRHARPRLATPFPSAPGNAKRLPGLRLAK